MQLDYPFTNKYKKYFDLKSTAISCTTLPSWHGYCFRDCYVEQELAVTYNRISFFESWTNLPKGYIDCRLLETVTKTKHVDGTLHFVRRSFSPWSRRTNQKGNRNPCLEMLSLEGEMIFESRKHGDALLYSSETSNNTNNMMLVCYIR